MKTIWWTEKLVEEQRKFDAVIALEVCSLSLSAHICACGYCIDPLSS